MNTDTLQLIGQIILIGLGPVLAKHGITLGNKDLDDILGSFSLIAGIIWKFRHWNATPNTPAATIPINKIVTALALTIGAASLCFGCVPIQHGQDPLVVNVERTETVGKATFDDALGIDNANREFYATNAPAFHRFCEWLRVPQEVPDVTSTNNASLTLPRASAILIELDNVKLDYKAARTSSNDLYTALQTVKSTISQANAWLVKTPTNSTSK